MTNNYLRLTPILLILSASASSAVGQRKAGDPLHFFEGNTLMVSTTKIITQKPYLTRSLGRGRIVNEGELLLVQHVNEVGRRQFDRYWHIREMAPGHFRGTMSEASGPVSIEKKGENYLFRFTLADNLKVEQWLIPQSESLVSVRVTIRKYGIPVVHSQGWIRRV